MAIYIAPPNRKPKRRIVLLLLAISVVTVPAASLFLFTVYRAMQIRMYEQRATRDYKQGDYQHSLEYCNKVLQFNPKSRWGYTMRGDVYYHLRRYREAIADTTTALTLARDARTRAMLFFNRGMFENRARDWEASIADETQAIALHPTDYNAYLERSYALTQQKRYEEVIEDTTAALKIKPDLALAYDYRGTAYCETNRAAFALRDHRIATELTPSDSRAWLNFGWTQYEAGNITAAIGDTRKALALNPKSVYGHFNLGLYAAIQGKEQEALAEYKQGLSLSPQADHEDTKKEIRKALAKYPDSKPLKAALQLFP